VLGFELGELEGKVLVLGLAEGEFEGGVLVLGLAVCEVGHDEKLMIGLNDGDLVGKALGMLEGLSDGVDEDDLEGVALVLLEGIEEGDFEGRVLSIEFGALVGLRVRTVNVEVISGLMTVSMTMVDLLSISVKRLPSSTISCNARFASTNKSFLQLRQVDERMIWMPMTLISVC
jgi:hypothetical protein